jgi:hypothetical protein
MKSYFLDGLSDEGLARAALSQAFPHGADPWLLKDELDDVVAYLTVNRSKDGDINIQADLSGRHHDEAIQVVQLLKSLRERLGGVVTDDDENVL